MLSRREAPPYPDLWHTAESHFIADAQVSNWTHGQLNTAMQQSGQLSWGLQTTWTGRRMIKFEADRDHERTVSGGFRLKHPQHQERSVTEATGFRDYRDSR